MVPDARPLPPGVEAVGFSHEPTHEHNITEENAMAGESYDLIVLGAGTGGYAAV